MLGYGRFLESLACGWGVGSEEEGGERKGVAFIFFLSKRGKEDNMEGRGGGGEGGGALLAIFFLFLFYCFYDSDASSFHVNFLM